MTAKIMVRIRGHWQLILLTALVIGLWRSDIVLPLRILVVFLHEVSHGTAAILTGGEVLNLTVNSAEGGMATTRGGSLFLTVSAGYLGSLLWGVILFLIALKTKADRLAVALLGGLMMLVAALFLRDFYALAFAGITGGALLCAAWFLPVSANDLILRLIGLTSMIYVPLDIFDDTIARSQMLSDARILARDFGGPTLFWGGLWLLISLVVIGLTLRFGLGTSSNLRLSRKPPSQGG